MQVNLKLWALIKEPLDVDFYVEPQRPYSKRKGK
jgi:hypothetical protein